MVYDEEGQTLAGGLVRRMAHDLASPLAAVQMLAEDGDPLLSEAVARLVDQLGLFRAVFGGRADAPVDAALLWRRLTATVAPAPLTLDIAPAAPPRLVKAAAALVLGLAGARDITLRIAADGRVSLRAPGARLRPDDPALDFARGLLGEVDTAAGPPLTIRTLSAPG